MAIPLEAEVAAHQDRADRDMRGLRNSLQVALPRPVAAFLLPQEGVFNLCGDLVQPGRGFISHNAFISF